jgi:hypothetical protein
LTASSLNLLGSVIECVHVALAAYEFRKTAHLGPLKAATERPEPSYLTHLDGLTNPFYHRRAE